MKNTTYATNLLKLLFNNTAFAGVGDASGLQPSGTAGSLYVSLHTADPGSAGSQNTSEASYTGYARVAVARSSGGWTVSSGTVTNAGAITFGACTAGSSVVSYFGIGTDTSGAGQLLYSFPLVQTYYALTGKASNETLTAPGHALSVNDPIVFTTVNAESLPGGISAGTTYYVLTVSGNDITISTSVGGGTLNVTSDGVGLVGKIASLTVSTGVTPEFLTGQLAILEG